MIWTRFQDDLGSISNRHHTPQNELEIEFQRGCGALRSAILVVERLPGGLGRRLARQHGAVPMQKCERVECCPRTGAKNCVEEPKFNDDGN